MENVISRIAYVAAAALPLILLYVAAFGFWIWMLVDCLLRSDERFPGQGKNSKLIYALVIILTNIIGAFIYLFMVKLKEPKPLQESTKDKPEENKPS